MTITYYTDGAQSSKDNIGGWAVVIAPDETESNTIISYGYEELTTNNRMELTAVYEALLAFQREAAETQGPLDCNIYTDSAYIANCFAQKWYKRWQRNGWKTAQRTPVLNQDLWEKIIMIYENINCNIYKVQGHANNQYNKLADYYAVFARKNKLSNMVEIGA